MSEKLKRIRTALIFAFLLIAGGIHAQTVKVTVKDSNGEPVIGASVIEKGTRNGGVTDFDGIINGNRLRYGAQEGPYRFGGIRKCKATGQYPCIDSRRGYARQNGRCEYFNNRRFSRC